MLWVLAGLLATVLAALVWVVLRTRSEQPVASAQPQQLAPSPRPAPRRPATSWGRMVVVPDPANACLAALKIQGQSLSTEAAPRLPLADCTMTDRCQCRYVPAPERRATKERRSGLDRRSQLRFEPDKPVDRRSGKDRRHRQAYDWDHTI